MKKWLWCLTAVIATAGTATANIPKKDRPDRAGTLEVRPYMPPVNMSWEMEVLHFQLRGNPVPRRKTYGISTIYPWDVPNYPGPTMRPLRSRQILP